MQPVTSKIWPFFDSWLAKTKITISKNFISTFVCKIQPLVLFIGNFGISESTQSKITLGQKLKI